MRMPGGSSSALMRATASCSPRSTSFGFSPRRSSTVPSTESIAPARATAPRRGVYASTTCATLRTRIGVPPVAFTTVLPMSAGERR